MIIITIILVLHLLIVQQLATGLSFNTPPPPPPTNNNNDRRDFLLQTTSATISLLLVPTQTQTANALVDISSSPPSPPSTSYIYNRPRNVNLDKFFANGMATEMVGYEEKARPYKQKLFQSLFALLSKEDNPQPTIVEVGMGTFPNAPYYAQGIKDNPSLQGFDIISVDPNDYMHSYAIQSAEKSGLISSSSTSKTTLRNVHGVAEALPFDDNSIDAVVGTLTLCSVTDQNRALQEIARVLKPNTGKYLFWEHVLSENDTGLMVQQKVLSPLQTLVADGCHLNRRTGVNIVDSGLFNGGGGMGYIVLDEGGIIAPTAYGLLLSNERRYE